MARRRLFALFECKITSFFSDSNGFMQKTAKSLLISYYMCTFVPDKEPFLRPVGSKRAELERKQAGGSESGVLRGTAFIYKRFA